jgi:hypothetical protein
LDSIERSSILVVDKSQAPVHSVDLRSCDHEPCGPCSPRSLRRFAPTRSLIARSSVRRSHRFVGCPVPGFSIDHNRSSKSTILRFARVVDPSSDRLHASRVSCRKGLHCDPFAASICDLGIDRSILDLLVPVASSLHSADLVSRSASGGCPASWLCRRARSILKSKSSQARFRSSISGPVSGKPCFRGIRDSCVAPKSFPLASSLHDP